LKEGTDAQEQTKGEGGEGRRDGEIPFRERETKELIPSLIVADAVDCAHGRDPQPTGSTNWGKEKKRVDKRGRRKRENIGGKGARD